MEKTDEKDEEEGRGAGVDVKTEVKKEEKDHPADAAAEGGAKLEPELGRLVMTIDGQQKQLMFGPDDLLSTATMLDGDKVSGDPLSSGPCSEVMHVSQLFEL